MYAVVGCNRCGALWVVEGRPDSTACPRCETRHRFEKLKRFAETESADAAREARSRLLAERGGYGEQVDSLDDFSTLGEAADRSGVSDEEFLRGSGIDTDAVNEAGERAETGQGGSRSRRQVVLDALEELDRPNEPAVIEYATDAGVPEGYAEEALERLRRTGEITESGGRYRRL
jgi:DNA replicative helicase MCM subunit Mcm2 (Cdc46/Mcm family)